MIFGRRKVILVQKKLFFIRKSYALKSSKKYFLPDDSGLYKNFFIGENDECRNLRKSIFCRMAGSKGGIPL